MRVEVTYVYFVSDCSDDEWCAFVEEQEMFYGMKLKPASYLLQVSEDQGLDRLLEMRRGSTANRSVNISRYERVVQGGN